MVRDRRGLATPSQWAGCPERPDAGLGLGGALSEPGIPTHLIPYSLEEAIGLGQSQNPDVIAAAYLEEAAVHNIKRVEAFMLPQVQVDASFTERFDPSPVVKRSETAQIFARMSVPFYQGGQVAAQVRGAKEQRHSRLEDIETARLQVRSDVITAWSQYDAAKAQLVSDRVQVDATRIALEGVREEEKVGQRTLLDVLNAEQEFLNAKVSLAGTERDEVVAAFSLISAVGRLSFEDLGLQTDPYDVESHYREVNGKAWGITIEREEGYEGYTIEGLQNTPPN